jgi:hypothetical protein
MAEKKVEIAVGVTGAKQADAELARITKRMDDMNARAVPSATSAGEGKGILGSLKESFGRGSELGGWLKVAAGGGAIYALSNVTHIIEKGARAWEDYAKGEKHAAEMAQELADSIPILGSLANAVVSYVNIMSGDAKRFAQASYWAKMNSRIREEGAKKWDAEQQLLLEARNEEAALSRRARTQGQPRWMQTTINADLDWGASFEKALALRSKGREGMFLYGEIMTHAGAIRKAQMEEANKQFWDEWWTNFKEQMERSDKQKKMDEAVKSLWESLTFTGDDVRADRRRRLAQINRQGAIDMGMTPFAYAPSQEWGSRMTGYGLRDLEPRQPQEQLKQLVSVNEKVEETLKEGFNAIKGFIDFVRPRVEAEWGADPVSIFGTDASNAGRIDW